MARNDHDGSIRQGRSNDEYQKLLEQLSKLENFRSGTISASEPKSPPILSQYSTSMSEDLNQQFNYYVQQVGDKTSTIERRSEATCKLWHLVRMRKPGQSLHPLSDKFACTSMELAAKRFNDPATEELLNSMKAKFQTISQGSKFSNRG